MSIPAVSVLMPVYNARRYVAGAVESILSQSFADFEFIIIDDGSTDGSLEILHRFARADKRIVLKSRPNRGLVATLNEGLAITRGKFLVRMDADDVSLPARIEVQIRHLCAHPDVVAVGCAIRTIDDDGLAVGEFRYPAVHEEIDAAHLAGMGGTQPHPASAFCTQALREIGGYRDAYRHAEDVDLFLRLAEMGRLANLTEVLYDYRQHLESISHKYAAHQRQSTIAAAQSARARRGMPALSIERETSGGDFSADEIRIKWAWWALGAGNLPAARKYARSVVLRRPWDATLWRLAFCALRGH